MEKSYVINRIKELCNKKNDREIALDFFYNNRIFHAKYLFLGNDLYAPPGPSSVTSMRLSANW